MKLLRITVSAQELTVGALSVQVFHCFSKLGGVATRGMSAELGKALVKWIRHASCFLNQW